MKKQYLVLLILALLPFAGKTERKVSKIYCYEYEYTNPPYQELDANPYVQELEYDENGRLVSWKEWWDDGSGSSNQECRFDHSFTYLDDRHIKITGLSDYHECTLDVTLNSDGLIETATLYEKGKFNSSISPSYTDGLMTGLTWLGGYRESYDFVIENGNPVSGIRGLDTQITYTDLPNKCGMAYLPFITNNTAWRFRSLALAGLEGYGSRNLAHSCQFDTCKPAGVIKYELDEEGYVLSMNITNTYDADGLFKFEYCEIAGIDSTRPDHNQVSVHAENRNIVIDGQYETVSVYNLLGERCGLSDLTPGIYIVDVDGSCHKTLVH